MEKRRTSGWVWVFGLLFIALAGVALGGLVGRYFIPQEAPIAAVVPPQPQPALPAAPGAAQNPPQLSDSEEAEAKIPRVTVEEARQKVGQPSVVFVDTRTADEFKEGRIKGALSLPLNEVETRSQAMPRDKDLILYCA